MAVEDRDELFFSYNSIPVFIDFSKDSKKIILIFIGIKLRGNISIDDSLKFIFEVK
jgi:hypothetical protein